MGRFNIRKNRAAHIAKCVLIIVLALQFGVFHIPVALSEEIGIVVSNGKIRNIENVPAILTGDVVVEKNSTLIMKNAMVQLSVRGEKGYNVVVKDRSTLVLRRSDIVTLHRASNITIDDSSNLIVEDDSSISGFQFATLRNASVTSFRSANLVIGVISGSTNRLELSRVNAPTSMMNISSDTVKVEETKLGNLYIRTNQLNARTLRVENLKVQCATASLNDVQAQTISVRAAELLTASNVRATTSDMYTLANSTIRDSVFGTLTAGARGQLYNVTTSRSPLSRAGGMVYAYNNSTLSRYWVLKVNVTDITMLPVPAVIEIRDYNMTLVDSAKVASDGTLSKPLISEVIANSTKFIGNYRVSAHYRSYATKQETIVLDVNKKMNLVFSEEIPDLASVTLSITPQLIFSGDRVTVRGRIRAQMKDQIVELTYVTPDGSKTTRAAITDKDGGFSDEMKVDDPGKWKLQAYWLGGETYSEGMASISRPTTFQVALRQSILNMVIFLVPILMVVIVGIIVIALMFLRKGGAKQVPLRTKPRRGAAKADRKQPRRKGFSIGFPRINEILKDIKFRNRHKMSEQTES